MAAAEGRTPSAAAGLNGAARDGDVCIAAEGKAGAAIDLCQSRCAAAANADTTMDTIKQLADGSNNAAGDRDLCLAADGCAVLGGIVAGIVGTAGVAGTAAANARTIAAALGCNGAAGNGDVCCVAALCGAVLVSVGTAAADARTVVAALGIDRAARDGRRGTAAGSFSRAAVSAAAADACTIDEAIGLFDGAAGDGDVGASAEDIAGLAASAAAADGGTVVVAVGLFDGAVGHRDHGITAGDFAGLAVSAAAADACASAPVAILHTLIESCFFDDAARNGDVGIAAIGVAGGIGRSAAGISAAAANGRAGLVAADGRDSAAFDVYLGVAARDISCDFLRRVAGISAAAADACAGLAAAGGFNDGVAVDGHVGTAADGSAGVLASLSAAAANACAAKAASGGDFSTGDVDVFGTAAGERIHAAAQNSAAADTGSHAAAGRFDDAARDGDVAGAASGCIVVSGICFRASAADACTTAAALGFQLAGGVSIFAGLFGAIVVGVIGDGQSAGGRIRIFLDAGMVVAASEHILAIQLKCYIAFAFYAESGLLGIGSIDVHVVQRDVQGAALCLVDDLDDGIDGCLGSFSDCLGDAVGRLAGVGLFVALLRVLGLLGGRCFGLGGGLCHLSVGVNVIIAVFSHGAEPCLGNSALRLLGLFGGVVCIGFLVVAVVGLLFILFDSVVHRLFGVGSFRVAVVLGGQVHGRKPGVSIVLRQVCRIAVVGSVIRVLALGLVGGAGLILVLVSGLLVSAVDDDIVAVVVFFFDVGAVFGDSDRAVCLFRDFNDVAAAVGLDIKSRVGRRYSRRDRHAQRKRCSSGPFQIFPQSHKKSSPLFPQSFRQ